MSQMTAARVAPRPAGTPSRAGAVRPTRLRVVDAAPTHRSHTGFVLLCAVLVIAGLMTALVLNTARAEGSFTLSDLRSTTTQLHDTKVTLQAELADHRSPQTLAARAAGLGMAPSPSTAVLRLSDSTVIGVADVAQAPPPPTVAPSSEATRAAAGAGPAAARTEDATEEG